MLHPTVHSSHNRIIVLLQPGAKAKEGEKERKGRQAEVRSCTLSPEAAWVSALLGGGVGQVGQAKPPSLKESLGRAWEALEVGLEQSPCHHHLC